MSPFSALEKVYAYGRMVPKQTWIFGHYERFLGVSKSRLNNATTGQIITISVYN